jgi:hypothetical protein
LILTSHILRASINERKPAMKFVFNLGKRGPLAGIRKSPL